MLDYFINDEYVDKVINTEIEKRFEKNILDMRAKYPNAKVLIHPECKPEISLLGDYIGSTSGIIDYVKNRIKDIPTFIDGIPTTTHEGHGYGVKSIVYMTQRLGGNYQFAVQNHLFTIRIII